MAKFRKKPVVIEAVQLTWSNWDEVCRFCNVHAEGPHGCYLDRQDGTPINGPDGELGLIIPTLEGRHIARENDWIIRGVKGEFYPCKPDIFEQTYEPATEPVAPEAPMIEIAQRLPEFQSHKIVRAALILAVALHDTGTGTLTLQIPSGENPAHKVDISVTSAYMQKHQPQVDGYYVLYQDGYESFSPAEAFEEGYNAVTPTTFLDRLKAEYAQLVDRTFKLRDFIDHSPVFIALDPRDKDLLRAQLTIMAHYLVILDERVARLTGDAAPAVVSYAGQNPIMQFFSYSHLPDKLRAVSAPLGLVAGTLDGLLPNSAEKSAGLRKLLEAKDCFVRGAL
jgi:hypothetical protein